MAALCWGASNHRNKYGKEYYSHKHRQIYESKCHQISRYDSFESPQVIPLFITWQLLLALAWIATPPPPGLLYCRQKMRRDICLPMISIGDAKQYRISVSSSAKATKPHVYYLLWTIRDTERTVYIVDEGLTHCILSLSLLSSRSAFATAAPFRLSSRYRFARFLARAKGLRRMQPPQLQF